MNPATNEIIDLDLMRRAEEAFAQIAQRYDDGDLADGEGLVAKAQARSARALSLPKNFETLPKYLDHAARCVLKGEERGVISRQSKGMLSKYAARRRREIRQERRS